MRGRRVFVGCLIAAAALVGPTRAGAEVRRGEIERVELVAEDAGDERSAGTRVVDDLEDEQPLRIRVTGFDWFERAEVMQCVYTTTRVCGNRIRVQTDDRGRADFFYVTAADFVAEAEAAGGCERDRNRCTIRIESADRERFAEIDAVFGGDARPPGTITLSRQEELEAGATVSVAVSGYPPGASFEAVLCRTDVPLDARSCGAPGPSTSLAIGTDGTGEATLAVAEGPVGTSELLCTRRTPCGVTLQSPDSYVRAVPVPISFRGRAGPEYDRTRLLTGLGVACALLLLAGWWMVDGEWEPPQEAAATALEDAEYADLDAMVAAQEAREAAAMSPDSG
jgi:hypothetical protein